MNKNDMARMCERQKNLLRRLEMLEWMIAAADELKPQWSDSNQMRWIRSVRDDLEVKLEAYTRFLVRRDYEW